MDKVSILIPCYNAERWITQAIESALAQDYECTEVIVVDDGSTDGSLQHIERFGDRISWETGPNAGGNRARNRLLELSEGAWLQYLDADDYLKPDKISQQMEALKSAPEADLIYGPSIIAEQNGDEVVETLKPLSKPEDPWHLLATWELPQTGSPLWRKSTLVEAGGWKEEQPCCQEHELYARLLCQGKTFVYTAASGSAYRQWSEDTVCKKNLAQVHFYQTEIRNAVQLHLRERGELTTERLRAFSQGHFDTARMLWLYDRGKAVQLMRSVLEQDPLYQPAGDAAPSSYQIAFRWLGFSGAERIAAWKRSLC